MMKVFMLGWEFPPHISGGLGTACYGLTKGLDEIGVEVSFVLPTSVPVATDTHVTLRTPLSVVGALRPAQAGLGLPQGAGAPGQALLHRFEHVQFHRIKALLQPYATPASHEETLRRLKELWAQGKLSLPEGALLPELLEQLEDLQVVQSGAGVPKGTFVPGMGAQYTGDLMSQVYRYARLAVTLSRLERFDVIHAHDWMTYPAGLAAKAASGKPLVVHVHSTEFDRSGANVNQQVYDIERAGMHGADRIVCVSHLTRSIVIARYGVPPEKVRVVYNAVEIPNGQLPLKPILHTEKIVLFLGRVTMQKGPEYFLRAAKKVVEKFDNVRFIMAGSGDMITACIREVADLGLGRYVTFTGFLRGRDVDRVFAMADLYVMPSVSEPFGIAPLEALSHNVPVIISKQSGVSEILTHALKVDFWDIDEMANKILAVLRHPPLQKTLRDHGTIELQKFSWRDSAERLREIYQEVVPA